MHKIRFINVPSRDLMGWAFSFNGETGAIQAFGKARPSRTRRALKLLVRRHGPRTTSALMGCDCTVQGFSEAVHDMTSRRAMRNLAGMLGVDESGFLKRLARGVLRTPGRILSTAAKAASMPANLLFRKRKTSSSPAPDESQQEEPQEEQQEDTQMEGMGLMPAAIVAFQQRRKLARLAKSSNPATRNAAKVLAKAKSGDPKEIKRIAVIKRAAKAGNPKAQNAMKRLQVINKVTKVQGGGGAVSRLYNAGITTMGRTSGKVPVHGYRVSAYSRRYPDV